MEDPDGDEVIQVNEEEEHPWSEVSATDFDDWHHKECAGKLKALQSLNDTMSIYGVPSSEVVYKEVIITRWVLKEQGETVNTRLVMNIPIKTWKDGSNEFDAGAPTPVTFSLVLARAAKRVAIGKSQAVACLDVSTTFSMRT